MDGITDNDEQHAHTQDPIDECDSLLAQGGISGALYSIFTPPRAHEEKESKEKALRQKIKNTYRDSMTEAQKGQLLHSLMNETKSSRMITADEKEKSFIGNDLGCIHYKRKCKMECSQCLKFYTCRFCHDANELHILNRGATQNMLCMVCSTIQPVGQDCRKCTTRLGKYYCSKCKFWDDNELKAIYHCDECGLCRMGQGLGRDYFHCKTCDMCMPTGGNHVCIATGFKSNCPICLEDMFTSTTKASALKCGHAIHADCAETYFKDSIRCPICLKTAINCATHFRLLDEEIQNTPMPAPYKYWKSNISCNDCGLKSNVNFNWVGHKCQCNSYNTALINVIKPYGESDGPEETEEELLHAMEQMANHNRLRQL